MQRPNTLLLSAALIGFTLTACSPPAGTSGSAPQPATAAATSPVGAGQGDGHGAIAGASEEAEPQLHLVTIDPAGAVDMLNLADETWKDADVLQDVNAVTTDGRYVFASSPGQGTVTIIDSGVWTWDHEDHFHYYRSTPRTVGKVEGQGEAVISGGAASTGVFFPETGEGVVLDNDGLSKGEIRLRAKLGGEPHQGMIVPLGEFVLTTVPGADGRAGSVRAHDAGGTLLDGVQTECAEAQGTITTPVGVVIGCSQGALLATVEDGRIAFEHIPYPSAPSAPPATEFRAREGRPTVAAVAGTQGAWILDTRERTWQLIETEVPLLEVSAVDDKEGHVVALSVEGRVLVLSAKTGATLSSSQPLLADTLAEPALLAGVEVVTDQQRAYINAPAEQQLHEIDFADNARVARTFQTPSVPVFFARTGR